MAKIAKTADRKKVMDTTKSTDCPKCGKPTRIVNAPRTANAMSQAACTSRARAAISTKSSRHQRSGIRTRLSGRVFVTPNTRSYLKNLRSPTRGCDLSIANL